jgi:protein gp37
MSAVTSISWCHHTHNPWIGCAAVSEGCRNCYARVLSEKYGWAQWGVNEPRHITTASNRRQPLRWNREAQRSGFRRRVFCASLADVFEDHPDLGSPRKQLFELIAKTKSLDWLLLTKRPENIAQMLPSDWGDHGYANVWLGTTVEALREADRLDHLRAVPAAVRFLSYEPALGPLDGIDLTGVDWVICGGESGLHQRPMNDDWARWMRDRCKQLAIPFWFKQYHGKRSGVRPTLDGATHKELPLPGRRQMIALKNATVGRELLPLPPKLGYVKRRPSAARTLELQREYLDWLASVAGTSGVVARLSDVQRDADGRCAFTVALGGVSKARRPISRCVAQRDENGFWRIEGSHAVAFEQPEIHAAISLALDQGFGDGNPDPERIKVAS